MSDEREGECCDTCRWWDQADPEEPSGYCRRHAPRPSMRAAANDILWPLVDASDFCGEHQPKDTPCKSQ